jgi:gliding motility-associated-like protein
MQMKDNLRRLVLILCLILGCKNFLFSQTDPSCSLITDNYSGQITSGRCAPVTLTMEVVYKFMVPVDPSKVQILYRWNDGTGAETIVNPTSSGDTLFRAVESHVYPPAGECSYTAEAFIIANGVLCSSSSNQQQSFSSWARDNENAGVLQTDPPEALFCEGEDVYVRFKDNSTFNCNIDMEPDKPNRLTRWVQFIYGTHTTSGPRIPNITVVDNMGVTHYMTDNLGNSLGTFAGPIIPVPINADYPNQTAFPIYAPAGGIAGDIFEITLRNWNICNAYDNKPFDGIPPVNLTDGDNPPITIPVLVRIITTPPVVKNTKEDFCANSAIMLSVPLAGDEIRWYTDSLRTNLIYIGTDLDPTLPPVNLDNTVAGKHRFYVTDAIGQCESAPAKVDIEIFDIPKPAPNAGPDQTICDNKTFMGANTPVIGTGKWTTITTSLIADTLNPATLVSNLQPGNNRFTWTITNGPCKLNDNVSLFSDRQPDPAYAGRDSSICNTSLLRLNAKPVNRNGKGTWSVIAGGANISNSNNPSATATGLTQGINRFVWTVTSEYGICSTTSDTVSVLLDLSAGISNVGPDYRICDVFGVQMTANAPINGGSGIWSKFAGTGIIANTNLYNTWMNNLSEGANSFIWTLSSQYGICPSSKDTLTVTVDLSPAKANAGADQYYCNVISSNLIHANVPTKGAGIWNVIKTPGGIPPIITPSKNSNDIYVNVNSGNEGRYDLEWRIQNGACISADSVIIDFGLPPSPADAGPNRDTCGLEIDLNAVAPKIGWGTWRQISGPGFINFQTGINDPKAHIQVGSGQEGTYRIEWKVASGSCPVNNSNIDTVTVVFRPKPLPPVVADIANCGPDSFTFTTTLNVNANVNRWYDAAVMGNRLKEAQVYTTPYLFNTRIYYVSGFNSISQCESNRVPITAIVNVIPSLPVASDTVHCGSSAFTLRSYISVNGTENRWYADSVTNTILSKSKNYITPVLNSSKSYYVSGYDSITGCESKRREIKVIIHNIPLLPTGSDMASCGKGQLLLTAQTGTYGNTVRWYDSIANGTLKETNLQFYTPTIDSTVSYFISSFNDSTGCESTRKEIKAIILPVPEPPLVQDLSSCGPDTLHFISIVGKNGTTNVWYNNFNSNTILHIGPNYNPYVGVSSTFWVTSYNQSSGCESPRVKVDGVIKAVPVTPQIVGPEKVALNQTNVVYSVYPRVGSQYFWTAPTDVDVVLQMENIFLLGFPQLGLKTISVYEIASNGCKGPLRTKDIDVKKEIMSIVVDAKDSGWCINEPVKLLAVINGGTPMYDITWTGDTAYLDNPKVADPLFTATTARQYNFKVSVTDVNGNYASDTVILILHENPSTIIPVSDTTVCGGQSVIIYPSTNGGSGYFTYHQWSGSINYLSQTNLPYAFFKAYTKGTYRLGYKVFDTNGCSASDSVTINVSTPIARFATDAKPACGPVTFNFTNNSLDGTNFLWTFGDGDSSRLINPAHKFINNGSSVLYNEVSLTASDAIGCTHKTSQFMQIYPNPDVPIVISPDTACSPSNVLLSATPGGYSYTWDFGDGATYTGGYNAYHEYVNDSLSDKTFSIKLVSTSFFGCMDTSIARFILHPSPKAQFTATPAEQMFPQTNIVLSNQTKPGKWNYTWDFGDGNTTDSVSPNNHSYIQTGNYTIRLVVRSEFCSDSTEHRIKILPHPPVAEFNPIDPGCMPLTVQFQNYSAYSDSYLWDFGDGSVSNKPNPVYTYYEAGNYTVKLTVKGEGGTDTKSRVSTVWVVPHAFFDIAPKYTYINDQPVNFFNMSENGDKYVWDFGDGSASEESNPSHLYTKEGVYSVTLKVTTPNNCTDIYQKESSVVVESSGKIEYPNVFSPFARISENKVFLPAVIDNVLEYHLMVFNRWGEMVFESFSKDQGWDGMYKGKVAKQDVYMWKVIGKYANGKSFMKTGDVTLLY